MANTLHSALDPNDGIHIPYAWTFSNATTRAAGTVTDGISPIVAGDVGKFGRQLDDNSIWMLTGTGPLVWIQVSGSGTTDADAIHDNVAGEISAITEKATPVSADLLVIEDSADSNNKKRLQIGNLPGGPPSGAAGGDLGGTYPNPTVNDGADSTALHDDTSGEISAITEKVTPVSGDLLVIEDSADSNNKKRLQIGNLPGGPPSGAAGGDLGGTYPNPTVDDGADGTAIHDDTSGEIAAVTEKATPVSADLLLIEDSADTNSKKRVQIGNLPGGPPSGAAGGDLGGTYPNPTVNDGADSTAIHDDTAGEITAVTEKATPVSADVILIEDSADANNKKRVQIGNLPDTAPTGAAGGDLGGTYPNPTVNDGADSTAIHEDVASEISAVTEKATPVSGDLLLIEDSADANNKKRIQIGNLPDTAPAGAAGGDLGGTYPNPTVNDGADSTAIHDDTAGEITAITEKATPVSADVLLIEDSAAANVKKRVQIGNLPGGPPSGAAGGDLGGTYPNPTVNDGADSTAIHEDVASEISAVTEKVTPVSADLLLIEDSADSNNKKRLQIGNLPGGPPSGAAGGDLGGTYPNPTVNDGADSTAIHEDVAAEISAITEKATPVSADLILIEDSAAANAKKRVQIGNLPGGPPSGAAGGDLGGTYPNPTVNDGADSTAIHDNVAGEIVAVTEKATPVSADVLLIEDSADTNNKKRIQIGNLPDTAPAGAAGGDLGGTYPNPTVNDGADSTALHDDTAGEISAITEKVTPVSADLLVIEDSADTNNKKRIQIGNLPGGPPSGAAGGDLGGTYPNPTVNDGADSTAIHEDVAGEIAAVAEKATPISADVILIEDSADSNNKKRVQIGNLPDTAPSGAAGGDLGGTYPNPTVNDGADSTAIHDNVAGEIVAVTEKATPVSADVLLIEDSADTNNKKRIQIGNLPDTAPAGAAGGDLGGTYPNPTVNDGADSTAIHDNVAAEISAVTEKVTPVSADLLLIEDSADTNNKKRLQIGNLPGGPPSGAAGGDLGGTYPNPTVDDGADGTAIHDNIAGEITAITEKATPAGADVLIIEDSADSNNKKRVQITNLPGGAPSGAAGGDLGGTYPNPTVDDGADGTAIHDNQSGEISAITEKTAPVSADLLVIEDSAATNAKKRVQVGNLPFVTGPGSAVNGGIPSYNGTGGDTLQDSGELRIIGSAICVKLTNTSGGTLGVGSVVVPDTGALSVTTTTSTDDVDVIGTIAESSTDNGDAWMSTSGIVDVLCTTGAISVGDYLTSSATAGQAETNGAGGVGNFAIALTAKTAGASGTVKATFIRAEAF